MEHWLQQAKKWLNYTSEQEFAMNSIHHFYNPDYKKGIPSVIYRQLESNRLQALDFIGTPSKFESHFRDAMQQFADHLYGKYRIKVPFLYELPKFRDATGFLRGIAFTLTQYSPKAFFTQLGTFNNIMLIAGPKNAGKSTAASMYYAWWKMHNGSREVLAGLDQKLATHFGWKPGRFTQAVDMLERGGFGSVGTEHAEASNISGTLGMNKMTNVNKFNIGLKFAAKAGKTMLDIELTPFKYGSASTRVAGHFAAFLEHTDRFPTAILDRQAAGTILQRASVLDNNMSSAMSSKLHTGAASIPFQFAAYDLRMAESMFGKQLTGQEKARMFAGMSAMYGLRGGYFALLGLPLGAYTIRKLQESGYVSGTNAMLDWIVNGGISWAFSYLYSDSAENGKRQFPDLSKFGNKGLDPVDKFFDSDVGMTEIMGGVVGNEFMQIMNNSRGFMHGMWSMVSGGDEFKASSQDVLQVFRALALIDDIDRTYLAIKFHQLYSRNDQPITDMGMGQAFIMGLTGVKPTTASDTWYKETSIKSLEKTLRAQNNSITWK